jgi:gluconokinase
MQPSLHVILMGASPQSWSSLDDGSAAPKSRSMRPKMRSRLISDETWERSTPTREQGDNVGRPPRVVVIMGPAGSGKTTVGSKVAELAGAIFIDADAHHPPHNVAKMQRGEPLSDEDRQPWLEALAVLIAPAAGSGRKVLACSALKASYRATLGADDPAIHFVFLDVPQQELLRRLETRAAHFFDPRLLDTQLAILEAPGALSPHHFTVDGTQDVNELAQMIIQRLHW